MENLVSVIIPIYNVEKYLKQCIESIINQTYKNLEIILINDGSKDNSINIINDYAQSDKRIKILDKENSGQGDCRNIGIDIASGKYIVFVDSDDYLKLDCIETLINYISKSECEMIIYNGVIFEDGGKLEEGNKHFSISQKYNNVIMPGKEFFKTGMDFIQPCIKIYNKQFIIENDIKFPKYKYGEDVYFWSKCCIRAQKVKYVDYVGYYRRMVKGSVSKTFNYEIVKENICTIDDITTLVEKENDAIFKKFLSVYCYRSLGKAFRLNNRNQRKKLIKLFKDRGYDKVIYKNSTEYKQKIATKIVCFNII